MNIDQVSRVVEKAESDGVHVTGIFDPGYAPPLKDLKDPPPVLLWKGDGPLVNPKQISIAGSRAPSAESVQTIGLISPCLAESGWSVVSGLAKGVDTGPRTNRRSGMA